MIKFNENNLEKAPCPLCKSKKFTYTSIEFHPVNLVKCDFCGLHYLRPRIREKYMLEIYSSKDYFFSNTETGYKDYSFQKQGLKSTYRSLFRVLQKKGYVGSLLLDIGCGYGYLLDEARGLFDYRAGTEFSKEAAGIAEKLCDRVFIGGIEEVDCLFDLITTISVLEHVYNPVDFMKGIVKKLNPGGAVVMVTPNIDSFWAKFMRRKWPSFKIPEHIAYYDRKTLNYLFEISGLKLMEFFPYHAFFPLGLIFEKLGFMTLPLKDKMKNINILIPNVMSTAVAIK